MTTENQEKVLTPTRLNNLAEDAAKAISQMAHGTLITHMVLAEMLLFDYTNRETRNRYYTAKERVRKICMQKHSIFLETSHKVGYLIVPCGKEIDGCANKFRKGVKTMGRAVAETNFINLTTMEETAKTETIGKVQKMSNVLGLTRGADLTSI